MDTFLLLEKEIDKSVLNWGFNIPVIFQEILYTKLGRKLEPGERTTIELLIDDVIYPVNLSNSAFDRNKYPNHPDIVRVLYSPNSPIVNVLRTKFALSSQLVEEHKNEDLRKNRLVIPDNQKEYLTLYTTDKQGRFLVDCITNNEYVAEAKEIEKLDERTIELAIDQNASIEEVKGVRKIRKMSRAIGNSLKQLYSYRCQICGEYIGEKYGSNIIHAHHIEYFTESLNNNAENIMIVCPNHHGIIHDKNPQYNKIEKTYTYPNGYVEGLLFNKHL